MGGLADIGRARPFSSLTGGLLENAQGLFRTNMAMEQMEQQRRSQDIQDRLNTMKLNEAQAAAEKGKRLVDIDEIPAKFAAAGQGEFGKAIHGYIKAIGSPQEVKSPDGTVKYFLPHEEVKSALSEYPNIMDKYPDFAKSMLWAQYSDSNNQLEALQGKLAKAKPEEADALKQQIDAAKGKRDQAIKAYNAFTGKADTEPLEKVETPEGPRFLPRSQAAGMTPYDPVADSRAEISDLRRDQLEETQRHNRAIEALNKEKQGGQLGFADKEALRAMGKQLPKSKIAAETASKNVQKIDRMLSLIDKGAGGVRGELLAKINKVADVMRRTSPEDAKYNQLKAELRGFAGTLRLQLGLVGQTSDRDVAIMYEAAGGMAPAESQKAILNGYRQGYMQDVTNYNSDAEAYSGYSKASKDLYRPVSIPAEQSAGPSVIEERTLKNGEVWRKFSDGTFKKVK